MLGLNEYLMRMGPDGVRRHSTVVVEKQLGRPLGSCAPQAGGGSHRLIEEGVLEQEDREGSAV